MYNGADAPRVQPYAMNPRIFSRELALFRRQSLAGPNGGNWNSNSAAVRYGITIGIVAIVMISLSAAYWHVKRRVAKGKQPLWYHRWMLQDLGNPRPQSWPMNHGVRRRVPRYGFHNRTTAGGDHAPEEWQPPPPVYSNEPPPTYSAPPGAPPKPEEATQTVITPAGTEATQHAPEESSELQNDSVENHNVLPPAPETAHLR